jgi:endonuclease/exonuclease/phosphatase (EEP) superfamily protein YafD
LWVLAFAGTQLCHQVNENRVQQTPRPSPLLFRRSEEPAILAGGFNAHPDSEPMQVLRDAGWVDTVAPRLAIDHVLVRSCDPWKVKEVKILDEPVASDHDPVLVVLQWQPAL